MVPPTQEACTLPCDSGKAGWLLQAYGREPHLILIKSERVSEKERPHPQGHFARPELCPTQTMVKPSGDREWQRH